MSDREKRNRRLDPWRVLFALALVGMAASLLGFLGRAWWPLEWFSHFRVQYFVCLIPFAGAFLWRRKWLMLAITCVFLAVNGFGILPLYFGGDEPASSGEQVRVMLLNVNSANRQHEQVVASIRAENPDVVLVMEVNQRWMEALSGLTAGYPYRVSRPRPDNFGIAFFSRLEPDKLEIQHIASTVPSVVARLKTKQGPFTVLGTHPVPPVNGRYARERNAQIAELARLARQTSGPVVLMGDLNTTSWSPFFSDLIEESGLRDSRRGFGVQTTWPDGLFFLRIPIDHCLVSKDIAVRDRRVGPSIGSDHFPVTVDMVLTGKERG